MNSEEIANDSTTVSNSLYPDDFAADFGVRKGARLARVYLAPGGVDSYVCYSDGQPIGRVDLLVHGEWAMIEYLVVIASKQRQGIGTAMMGALRDEALKRGAKHIVLVADADDTPKEMYQKLGFTAHRGRTSLLFQW